MNRSYQLTTPLEYPAIIIITGGSTASFSIDCFRCCPCITRIRALRARTRYTTLRLYALFSNSALYHCISPWFVAAGLGKPKSKIYQFLANVVLCLGGVHTHYRVLAARARYRVRARNDRSRVTIAEHHNSSISNEAIEPPTTNIIT
jgi:hypothetical protein